MRFLTLLLLCAPLQDRPDLCRMWSRGKCPETKGTVRFTCSPMDVEDVATVTPMGMMVDAHVTPIDHIYFSPKDWKAGRARYEVKAPADGWIVQIQRRTQWVGDKRPDHATDEYRLVIAHTCTFWTYYDLITKLDDAVVKEIGGEPKDQKPVMCRIAVKAGQAIGRVGGQTLDFAVVSKDATLKGFVVPEHYDREPWKVHTVDPFDFLDEPLKSKLLALNPRKAEPRGGRIDYDVDGRLVGSWFLLGTNGYAGTDKKRYWSGHLSIAYHHIDASLVVVSIGDFEGRSRQLAVKGNGPDPAKVSADSGVVRYELVDLPINGDGSQRHDLRDSRPHGTMLVQVLPERRLKMEVFPGREADAFTAGARTYER